jgi:NADH-quinone oxidoreductase subunit L
MAHQHLLVPAAILLFGGAIGKSAQFPLNEWLLEAMTGPASVSALIHAATMVKAGVFLVARIAPLFFALAAFGMAQFFEVVAWVGAFTAFLLASQAIANPEIKKVLAYSTGSQIGYMMMAIGIAGLSTNFAEGYTAGFFQLISHAMFKAALFMGSGALLHVVGSRFMTDMGGMRKYMKKTYIFMLLGALSLAAAPLVTLGFWSKDAIFASVLESGYVHTLPLFIIAVVVAMMTAFYSFRMIGMTFFGKKSDHLEQLEKSGHPLHEVSPIVWVPFGILAVGTIAFGVVGFAFGAELQHIFTGYLANYFGITEQKQLLESTTTHIVQPHVQTKLFLGLNPIAAAASFGAFAVGGFLGYMFYISRKMDPQIVSKNGVTRAIWKFLYNRWYLNSAIYWGAVIGPVAIYRIVWRYFEIIVMDGINHAFEYLMALFSKVVKAGQTGITQTYLFVFGVGIMLIIMLLLL